MMVAYGGLKLFLWLVCSGKFGVFFKFLWCFFQLGALNGSIAYNMCSNPLNIQIGIGYSLLLHKTINLYMYNN